MKVLRGISAIIIGIFLVSCADQYNASERFVAERGVKGINNINMLMAKMNTQAVKMVALTVTFKADKMVAYIHQMIATSLELVRVILITEVVHQFSRQHGIRQ